MDAAQESRLVPGGQKLLFVSYARADKDALRPLEEGVEILHHQLWIDRKLQGGQAWWDEILMRIRECDAMLIAVSPALLDSDAAARERQYAGQLGKTLIPVLIAPVLSDLLPPEISSLQFIDYTNVGPMTAFQLASALFSLPPTPPLPDPLPPPPPVPVSYMSGLSNRILHEPLLSPDDQLGLVASLRAAMERPRERAAAVELLNALRQRRDLYYRPGLEVEELLRRNGMQADDSEATVRRSAAIGETGTRTTADSRTADSRTADPGESAGGAQPVQAGNLPAPGWYPDPSSRHRLRWFDGDWTAYASDQGDVIEDPDF